MKVYFIAIFFFIYGFVKSQNLTYTIDTALQSFNKKTNLNNDTIPITKKWQNLTDLDYEKMFFELNLKTPIDFDYNPIVKQHIDFFLYKRRDLLSKVMGLSKFYFPIIEEALDKYGLPLELKYLAIVESALNPVAKSKTGAIGLWQFKYNTALMLDLTIDNYIDERQDPVKSTDAACRYLDFLFNTFNDWQLALASYNGGPGLIRNSVARSQGKSQFWDLRNSLPEETKGYVPAFLAIAFLLENAKTFEIEPSIPPLYYHQVDTVLTTKALHFQRIADYINVPLETIRFLNPIYKKNYIPAMAKAMPINLPTAKIPLFIEKLPQIAEQVFPAGQKSNLFTEEKIKVIHTVEKGEYLNRIALLYRCSIENIIEWNQLSNNAIHSGQELILWVPLSVASQVNSKKETSDNTIKTSENQKTCTYIVVKGDTLYQITKKYTGLTVPDLVSANNLNKDTDLIP